MNPFPEVVGAALLVLALLGSAYAAFAGVAVRRFAPRTSPLAGASLPPLTLLKPLHGEEPGLREALESGLVQDYPAPVQTVFGIQDPADPARRVVEALRQAHPDADIALVIESRVHGVNAKISNLINMAAVARHGVVVLADSDIAVRPDYLRGVVTALIEPGVGVATCPYYGLARAGSWSRLAAMGISYQFLPSVAVGVSLGLAHPCMGSTIALRRETLDRIGGLQAFRDVLADDYEIGRAVREAGYRSVVAPVLVAHGCAESSFGELVRHELRWARTVKGVDPAGFFGSAITHPLAFAILGTALLRASPAALLVLGVSLLSRWWLMSRVDQAARTRSGVWWLLPLRDILSFGIFVGSFFGRGVEWRGTRFRVDRRGSLSRL